MSEFRTDIILQEKYCTKCCRTKPVPDGFYKNAASADGLSHHCRDCAARYRALRRADPEVKAKRRAESKQRHRVLRGAPTPDDDPTNYWGE